MSYNFLTEEDIDYNNEYTFLIKRVSKLFTELKYYCYSVNIYAKIYNRKNFRFIKLYYIDSNDSFGCLSYKNKVWDYMSDDGCFEIKVPEDNSKNKVIPCKYSFKTYENNREKKLKTLDFKNNYSYKFFFNKPKSSEVIQLTINFASCLSSLLITLSK